jgi:hypothetical protein
MSPITHFLVGWTASLALPINRRDRGLLVVASTAPDLDSLVVAGDLAQGSSLDSLELLSGYHHVIAHNIGFALAVAVACGLAACKSRCSVTDGQHK